VLSIRQDFEPIAVSARSPHAGDQPAAAIDSTAELIAYARANPGKLTYGQASSASLVAAETLNTMAKVSIVAYRTRSARRQSWTWWRPAGLHGRGFHHCDAEVKAGEAQSARRDYCQALGLMPDVPPIGDTLKGFDSLRGMASSRRRGPPKEIVARLARETLEVLARPDVKARLAVIGYVVDPQDSEPFGRFVRDEIASWGKLVRAAGIQPE